MVNLRPTPCLEVGVWVPCAAGAEREEGGGGVTTCGRGRRPGRRVEREGQEG